MSLQGRPGGDHRRSSSCHAPRDHERHCEEKRRWALLLGGRCLRLTIRGGSLGTSASASGVRRERGGKRGERLGQGGRRGLSVLADPAFASQGDGAPRREEIGGGKGGAATRALSNPVGSGRRRKGGRRVAVVGGKGSSLRQWSQRCRRRLSAVLPVSVAARCWSYHCCDRRPADPSLRRMRLVGRWLRVGGKNGGFCGRPHAFGEGFYRWVPRC